MHLYFAFCWMDTKSLQSKFFSVADMTVADINVGETTKLLTLLNFLDGELRFQFSQFLKVGTHGQTKESGKNTGAGAGYGSIIRKVSYISKSVWISTLPVFWKNLYEE